MSSAIAEPLEYLLRSRYCKLNLKSCDVAAAMGVTICYVNHMHDGEFIPDEERLVAVATAYKLSLDQVLDGWLASKSLRDKMKAARRSPKARKPAFRDCDVFPAQGSRGHASGRHKRS